MATIPICPLMSAGNESTIVCTQERCAWYMNGSKTFAMYVMAHKAIMDIKAKQAEKNYYRSKILPYL